MMFRYEFFGLTKDDLSNDRSMEILIRFDDLNRAVNFFKLLAGKALSEIEAKNFNNIDSAEGPVESLAGKGVAIIDNPEWREGATFNYKRGIFKIEFKDLDKGRAFYFWITAEVDDTGADVNYDKSYERKLYFREEDE